jgi:23S rRNA pseudouridine1911/1915/1917 synthase
VKKKESPRQAGNASVGSGPEALDAVVRDRFSLSWGRARQAIVSGKVFVNGERVLVATRPVRAADEVELRVAAPRPERGASLAKDALIYVDAHVVVVAKPPGISTVPFDEGETGTLDALVRAALPTARGEGRGARPSLGVVHRIDKETSGLLVFTRTWLAKQSLSQQFRRHTVHRRYDALVHGSLSSRTIESHILPDRGDGLRGSLEALARWKGPRDAGDCAVTHVRVVERFSRASHVSCVLETGRTHQIRIHLSEAGCPLIGERVYIRGFARDLIPAPRLMLHAAELGFVHPATGEELQFALPMPDDMRQVHDRLGKE